VKRPFTLIPTTGSEDTERCVEALQHGVKAKKLIGLAYVAIYSQRNYEVHLCGEADRSPTFCRGAVSVLDDKLRERIHGYLRERE
jgi:hypothetical protein